jgi:chemotaxis protein CheX
MKDPYSASIFALPVILDMQAALPLKTALMARWGAGLTINASLVEKLGAQCLQVLLAARKSWDEAGQDFTIDSMSDSFASALAGLGVMPASLNTGK